MSIKLDRSHLKGFVLDKDVEKILPQIKKAHDDLENRKGAGHEYTGWMDLPSRTDDSFLNELDLLGLEARDHSDCIISIGIGGSYLGIRASIEFLRNEHKVPVYFAGHNISADYHYQLLE